MLMIATSVTAGVSIIKGRVYEKWYNDFLETSFLLNLCILSTATFYVQSEKSFNRDEVQSIISSVSVGIIFVYFLGISVFHSYQRIRKLKLFQDVLKSYRLKKQSDEVAYKEQSLSNEMHNIMAPKEPSLKIMSHTNVYMQLRESLLDDDCN